jgi:hypothetical protein
MRSDFFIILTTIDYFINKLKNKEEFINDEIWQLLNMLLNIGATPSYDKIINAQYIYRH